MRVRLSPNAPISRQLTSYTNGVSEYDTAKRKTIRHRRIIKHFTLFIDRRWYPDFQPTPEIEKIFLNYQSYGRKKISPEDFKKIEPLMNGQELYELTIKMQVEEMLQWWSNGWGWHYPLQSSIDYIKDDRIHKLALLKIKKRCNENYGMGFIDFINSYTGLTQEEKDKYFKRKFG